MKVRKQAMNKKINSKIKDIVLKYVEAICNKYEVEAIILFGSFAKGTENEDSDIDIAIVIDKFKDNIIEEEVEFMKLRKGIDYRIEPHIIRIKDYKEVSTPFVKEVIDTGIKVAQKIKNN